MATTSPDRILSLDVIRGIAVMGIFSVNIVGMGLLEQAYFYPPDYGFDSPGDKVMWVLNSIFVDGRFRSLFSILFGASMVLVIDRAVAAGKAGWQVHYPRMIVLLGFGVLHYYLLWWGDILINYAGMGMVAYLFWRLSPKWLIVAAVAILAYHHVPDVAETFERMAQFEAGTAADATPEQQAKAAKLVASAPPGELAEAIARDQAKHSSVAAHLEAQTSGVAAGRPWRGWQSYGFETLGLMLLGMAGYKLGFLTGAWRRSSYLVIAVVCLGIDLSFHTIAAYLTIKADFSPPVYFPWTQTFPGPLHAVGALGYAALIVLLIGKGALTRRVAAVGRTAFSNYLGATLLGTVLFSGSFLGWYGDFSRGELWLFAPGVWLLMLLWSKPWLDRFRYGPFEWVWRSLARWRWEPMRRAAEQPAPTLA